MNIFIEEKRLLRWIGVLEFNHPHSKMIQYFIVIIVCGNIFPFILSTFWFFCFNAETIIEYAESFYAFAGGTFSLIIYFLLFWHREEILELIMKMEGRINECMLILVK